MLHSEYEFLVKHEDVTDIRYGKTPEAREISELIKSGCINIDKPRGPTSHQVVAWIKETLSIDKAGHGGTLDPKVTGVLPVALCDAAKALEALLHGNKEYVGVIRLHRDVNEKRLREVCAKFIGVIEQMPPVRSAVKRRLRKRTVYSFDIIEIDSRNVLFKIKCQAGTYVRTLIHDIGKKLEVGAHMQELRRSRACSFEESQSITLHKLKDAVIEWKEKKDDSELKKIILPMERILDHLPKLVIRDSAVDAICHGANLAIPGIVKLNKNIERNTVVGIFTLKGEAVAIGKAFLSAKEITDKKDGYAVDTERVLMSIGTYHACWRKKR